MSYTGAKDSQLICFGFRKSLVSHCFPPLVGFSNLCEHRGCVLAYPHLPLLLLARFCEHKITNLCPYLLGLSSAHLFFTKVLANVLSDGIPIVGHLDNHLLISRLYQPSDCPDPTEVQVDPKSPEIGNCLIT